ncbi:MAG: pyridoxamine 5'-phosphate oxidase [Gemmatimonadetes bacterium]|nr:pyridoxamine 5'-phosphate oxidase [Gemmatimonadota bacterium]
MSLKSSIRTIKTLGKGVVVGIPEAAADHDPVELFGEWFQAARESGLYLPESMSLATATPDGVPSVRMVLLKAYDERGFVFYTNYESRKAKELEANPRGALCFHWGVLERQVRLNGTVERVSHEESVRYFATRSRGSRIGAWASKQSEPLSERAELEDRVRRYDAEYPGDDVPLPPFWGGYRLRPESIEFWQGKADRLHERLRFERSGDGWRTTRLYP